VAEARRERDLTRRVSPPFLFPSVERSRCSLRRTSLPSIRSSLSTQLGQVPSSHSEISYRFVPSSLSFSTSRRSNLLPVLLRSQEISSAKSTSTTPSPIPAGQLRSSGRSSWISFLTSMPRAGSSMVRFAFLVLLSTRRGMKLTRYSS